jgi:multicomponent Na+:H+ antiporter subunit D
MNALVLPLLLPLASAVLGLLLRRAPRLRAPLGVLGAALQLAAAAWLLAGAAGGDILTLEMGGWAAPFGIVLVADLTSAIFLATCAFTAFGVALHASLNPIGKPLQGWFFPLMHFLLLGVNGALLTGDLFNLFVWFEVMLITSFVLMVIGGKRPQLEGGFKYVVINLFSSALFLAGIGILYGKTGSLNMADIALKMQGMEDPQLVRSSVALLLASFAIKAGLFPLFFWLPASYHTPQPVVTALFAGLLTKVGVYACIRTVTLFLWDDFAAWQDLFLWTAALTMITGVLGAYAQFEVRRILAFHIISQIGYLVAGLAMFTVAGLAAALFYFIHNNLAKTNLLLLAAAVQRRCGTGDLARLGGLYRAAPGLSALFLVSALALAGIPPLSGFWAKLGILHAGLEGGFHWLAAAALGVGILTLMSMTKIWAEVFWKAPPDAGTSAPGAPLPARALLAVGLFTAAILLLSFGGEPVFRLSLDAAAQLLEPARYVNAVLGGGAG